MRVSVEDLSFSYPGGIQAIRDLSITIEAGESVAIVGQNGAGKTTLVRHFNGLLKPERGRVSVGDWDTKKYSVARLASRVGYVFQNPDEQLFCRTIQDEVAFGPVNLGYTSERVQELVKDAIEQANLEGKETTNPYDLSATWRKMIAVAAVIAMDTPIVIFDEPTTGQDAAGVARIAAVISALRQRGKTVITITHDIDFCAENFHRVIAMAHGQVLLDGSMAEVLAQEELLATTFIDPPQITRLAKRLGLPGIAWDCDTFLHAYEAWKK